MKEYSIFQAPFLSFYSKDVYRDVAKNWTGPGLGYLLFVLAVCWLVTMVNITPALFDFFDNEVPKLVDQVPAITIKDGEVSIEEPQPYYIKDPEQGTVAVIIDTTGSITSLEGTDAKFLLMKTECIYEKSETETGTIDLSETEEFTLTREMIYGWTKIIKALIVPVTYLGALVLSYLARILQALVYALLGMGLAAICKVKFSFETLLRLAIVAVTPMMLIKTAVYLSGVDIPWAGLWYFLGAMGYLYFAIKANVESQRGADAGQPKRQGAPR